REQRGDAFADGPGEEQDRERGECGEDDGRRHEAPAVADVQRERDCEYLANLHGEPPAAKPVDDAHMTRPEAAVFPTAEVARLAEDRAGRAAPGRPPRRP